MKKILLMMVVVFGFLQTSQAQTKRIDSFTGFTWYDFDSIPFEGGYLQVKGAYLAGILTPIQGKNGNKLYIGFDIHTNLNKHLNSVKVKLNGQPVCIASSTDAYNNIITKTYIDFVTESHQVYQGKVLRFGKDLNKLDFTTIRVSTFDDGEIDYKLTKEQSNLIISQIEKLILIKK